MNAKCSVQLLYTYISFLIVANGRIGVDMTRMAAVLNRAKLTLLDDFETKPERKQQKIPKNQKH